MNEQPHDPELTTEPLGPDSKQQQKGMPSRTVTSAGLFLDSIKDQIPPEVYGDLRTHFEEWRLKFEDKDVSGPWRGEAGLAADPGQPAKSEDAVSKAEEEIKKLIDKENGDGSPKAGAEQDDTSQDQNKVEGEGSASENPAQEQLETAMDDGSPLQDHVGGGEKPQELSGDEPFGQMVKEFTPGADHRTDPEKPHGTEGKEDNGKETHGPKGLGVVSVDDADTAAEDGASGQDNPKMIKLNINDSTMLADSPQPGTRVEPVSGVDQWQQHNRWSDDQKAAWQQWHGGGEDKIPEGVQAMLNDAGRHAQDSTQQHKKDISSSWGDGKWQNANSSIDQNAGSLVVPAPDAGLMADPPIATV